jgi:hypothetical protein
LDNLPGHLGRHAVAERVEQIGERGMHGRHG